MTTDGSRRNEDGTGRGRIIITVSMTTDVSGRNGVGGGSGRGKMMKDEIDINDKFSVTGQRSGRRGRAGGGMLRLSR